MTPADEDSLFRAAVADAVPLASDQREPYRRKRAPFPIEQPAEPQGREEFADLSIETQDALLFMRPGLQLRRLHDLRRGKLPPEDTLDLHGYRVEEARLLLRRFLEHARQQGHRCVRIIHGKGRGSDDQQPVLKQKVDQWLPQADGVLAYCSAPGWDGGTGATYVLLARIKAAET